MNINTHNQTVTITLNNKDFIIDIDKINLFLNPPKSITKYDVWHYDNDNLLYIKTNNNGILYLYEILTNQSRYKMDFYFNNDNIFDYTIKGLNQLTEVMKEKEANQMMSVDASNITNTTVINRSARDEDSDASRAMVGT